MVAKKLSFEEKIRMFMRSQKMYEPGSKVLAGVSGGKDSIMLSIVLKYVSEADNIKVELLHLNFGQRGSELLEKKVTRFAEEIGLPVRVWRMKEEWGIGIKELSRITRRNPCSLCSTLLRYYLLWFGREYDTVMTGHNLDDMVSFYLYNAMTGNYRYSSTLRPVVETVLGVKKARPFFFIPEEKIKEELEKKGFEAFPTGCPSEEKAPTVKLREFLKSLEQKVPGARKNLLKFFIQSVNVEKDAAPRKCKLCGMPSRSEICSVCRLKIKVGLISDAKTGG